MRPSRRLGHPARQHRVKRNLRWDFRPLTGSAGIVLDPVFSLRCRVALEPLDQFEFVLVTLIANSREEALNLATKYHRPESITRSFEMAWTRSQLEFRYLGIGPTKSHRFQELAGNLLYSNPNLRVPGVRLQRNRLGQSGLWGFGISGDLPMVIVIIADVRSLPLVRELLLAHTYWQMRGFRADLIVLNQEFKFLGQNLIRSFKKIDPNQSVYNDHNWRLTFRIFPVLKSLRIPMGFASIYSSPFLISDDGRSHSRQSEGCNVFAT